MIVPTWEFWARQFLKAQGLPCNLQSENMIAVLSWMRTENTSAQWNPLATTLHYNGSVDLTGSIGNTQQYITFTDGQLANIETLQHTLDGFGKQLYANILWKLRSNAWAEETCAAITNSPWGTKIAPSTVAWVRANYGIIGDRSLNKPFPNV